MKAETADGTRRVPAAFLAKENSAREELKMSDANSLSRRQFVAGASAGLLLAGAGRRGRREDRRRLRGQVGCPGRGEGRQDARRLGPSLGRTGAANSLPPPSSRTRFTTGTTRRRSCSWSASAPSTGISSCSRAPRAAPRSISRWLPRASRPATRSSRPGVNHTGLPSSACSSSKPCRCLRTWSRRHRLP